MNVNGNTMQQPGGLGGFLLQIREKLKTDPNFRQAWMAGSAAMMQPAGPGQNPFGMIGQGIGVGVNTLNQLRQQNLANQRADRQVDLQGEGVELQRQGLAARKEEAANERAWRGREAARERDWKEGILRDQAALERELAKLKADKQQYQATHPNKDLYGYEGNLLYLSEPQKWDALAAEANEGRTEGQPLVTGRQLAEYDVSQQYKYGKLDPNLERRIFLQTQADMYKQLHGDRWLDEMLGQYPEHMWRGIQEELQNMAGAGPVSRTTPGGPTAPSGPRPPQYVQRLEQGATALSGEALARAEEASTRGVTKTEPDSGIRVRLAGSKVSGFWLEGPDGKRYKYTPDFFTWE